MDPALSTSKQKDSTVLPPGQAHLLQQLPLPPSCRCLHMLQICLQPQHLLQASSICCKVGRWRPLPLLQPDEGLVHLCGLLLLLCPAAFVLCCLQAQALGCHLILCLVRLQS